MRCSKASVPTRHRLPTCSLPGLQSAIRSWRGSQHQGLYTGRSSLGSSRTSPAGMRGTADLGPDVRSAPTGPDLKCEPGHGLGATTPDLHHENRRELGRCARPAGRRCCRGPVPVLRSVSCRDVHGFVPLVTSAPGRMRPSWRRCRCRATGSRRTGRRPVPGARWARARWPGRARAAKSVSPTAQVPALPPGRDGRVRCVRPAPAPFEAVSWHGRRS
jgi:hypothetical protein